MATHPYVIAFFSFAVLGSSAASAQNQERPVTPTSQTLKIFVLQGQNAVNSIAARRAIAPVVEVRDENDSPVEGAEVTFELPATGPGGSFGDGRLQHTAKTNLQGQATAVFIPNQQPGRFEIKVTAQSGNRVGNTTIAQTNSTATLEAVEKTGTRSWLGRWKWVAIGGGAAAVVTGVLLATRNGSGPSDAPTITITPGGPVFGGPR